MQHYKCGGTYIEQRGSRKFNSKYVGSYLVHDIFYSKCDGCGALLFPLETARKIESAEQQKLVALIAKIPGGNLVSSTEAADILGVSRQAFHKHRRIKNGFVYSIVLGGNKFFDKKSLLLFKETGDGRYMLSDEKKHAAQAGKVLSMPDVKLLYSPTVQILKDFTSRWSLGSIVGYTHAIDYLPEEKASSGGVTAAAEFDFFKFRDITSQETNKSVYGD